MKIIKRKLMLFGLVIALVFGSLFSFNFLNIIASANTTRQQENKENEKTVVENLQFGNNLHYVNLKGATEFEKFDNGYFLVINSTLHFYNTESFEMVAFYNYSNASNLSSANNHLFFINNSELTILNQEFEVANITEVIDEDNENPENQNQTSIRKFTLTNINFAISYDNNNLTTTLAFVENNQINIVLLDQNLTILQEENQTINSDKQVLSLALSENHIFTYHSDNLSQPEIIKINLDNLKSQENYFIDENNALKIKHIRYQNISVLSFLTHQKIVLLNENNLQDIELEIKDNYLQTPAFVSGDLRNMVDFDFTDNTILILDSVTESLQQFDIIEAENNEEEQQATTLETANPKILLASTSYEIGRFNHPNHLYTASKNLQIVTDTKNKRVQIITHTQTDDELQQQIISINNLKNPIKTQIDNHQNIYILQNNSVGAFSNYEILKYDKNGTFLNHFEFEPELQIPSFSINSLGEIVALNASDNEIIELNSSFEIVTRYKDLSISLNRNSKIVQTYSGKILLQSNNLVYLVQNNSLINTLELEQNILDLDADFLDNVFLLTESGITKYTIENNEFVLSEKHNHINFDDENILNLNSITLLSVDRGSGEIYLFNNSNQQLLRLKNKNFSAGLTGFIHPVDVYTHPLQNSFIKVYKTKQKTIVYEYPHFIGSSFELDENQTVYVVDDYDEQFAMILFKTKSSNFINQGYIIKDLLQENFIAEKSYDKKLKVVFHAKILTYPTMLKDYANNTPIIEFNLNEDVLLTPISDVFVGIDGNEYYAISWLDNTIAYVLNHNLMFVDVNENNNETIKPNRELTSENNEILVYGVNSDSKIDTAIILDTLPNKFKVFVENFNNKNEFTLIRYLNDENKQVVGFVKTENIKTNNLTDNQLTSLLISGAGILLLSTVGLVFRYQRKKRRD